MYLLQFEPTIVDSAHDEIHISSITIDMRVLASHLINQPRIRPQADAPAGTGVGRGAQPVLPVPGLLTGDLPEGAMGTPVQLLTLVTV